mgnify:CR=1 FL=1
MGFVIRSWLVLFILILSLGYIIKTTIVRMGGAQFGNRLSLFQVFWLGFAAIVSLTQGYNIFWPLDDRAARIFIVIAMAGTPFLVRDLVCYVHHFQRTRGRINYAVSGFYLIAVSFLIFKAAHSICTPPFEVAYDTNLYHLTIVRAANEYAAIPGIANLHCRLGFNSSFLLFSALIDNLWLDKRSFWISQGLLFLVMTAQWIAIVLLGKRHDSLAARLFCVFSLPYLLLQVTQLEHSLYFDSIALAFIMATVYEILRSGLNHGKSHRIKRLQYFVFVSTDTVMIMTMATLAFSTKLTGAVTLVLAAGYCLYVSAWGALRFGGWPRIRALGLVFLIPLATILPFVTRNIILSGWPLYPVPVFETSVSWAVPRHPFSPHVYAAQSVDGLSRIIKGWARKPGDGENALTKGFWYWFAPWRQTNKDRIEPKLLIGGVILLALRLSLGKSKVADLIGAEKLVIALCAANFAFWFFTAPEMRFGDGLFWIWFAVCGSIAIDALRSNYEAVAVGALAVFLWMFLLAEIPLVPATEPVPVNRIPVASSRQTRPVVFGNNQDQALVVNVPVHGDLAGDAPLPCSPYINPHLMMRQPGNLSRGFYIDQQVIKKTDMTAINTMPTMVR